MRSLRRDLLEHKLWPVAALLLALVVAIPLFLLKGAPAANGIPTPPVSPVTVPAVPSGGGAGTVPVKVLVASVPRNPFASGMPKLTPKPASPTKPPASASSSTTTTSSSTTTTPAAMVSPSPAATSTTTTSSSTTTTPATTPATTSTPSTTPSSTPLATPAAIESWTLYSVSVRFGQNTSSPIHRDLARLTPLPSAKQPEVMFMGVMAGGRHAVFMLGAGITPTGPGLCRPDRARCAAVVLQDGQSEQLTVPAADSTKPPSKLILRLVHVYSHVTHSRSAALAAYQRHSHAGLCDLDLASPVSYSQTTGTLSTAATAACRTEHSAVPFPTS